MKKLFLKLRDSLWIVPALYSLSAVLLSLAVFYVESRYGASITNWIPSILMTSVELAKTIMGGLSAALLTMTTFTFSTIMVVLTTYSSQFSPRTLKNFVQDRMTWRVLGIFMGGFLYNTLSLLFMRDSFYNHMVLSATVGILIALICLAFFAVFIHHVATSIQVSTLIQELADDALEVIEQYEQLNEQHGTDTPLNSTGKKKWPVPLGKSGYIQWVDFDGLAAFAGRENAVIELAVHIGDFVHEKQPVLFLYADRELELELPEFIAAGKDRDTRQDPEFAVQKLVEVALRAISPGINDPNTAVHNIRQLGRLLGQMSRVTSRFFVFRDENEANRLWYPLHSFQHILYYAFFQIRHYGKEDVSILMALTEALTIASAVCEDGAQQELWGMQLHIIEGMKEDMLLPMDRRFYQMKINELADSTGSDPANLPD